MTFQWLNQNPLYDLARQGKRLTPWWLLVPLAWAMIFVAGFFALPLVIALVSLYGFSLGGFMQDLNALPRPPPLSGKVCCSPSLQGGLFSSFGFGRAFMRSALWPPWVSSAGTLCSNTGAGRHSVFSPLPAR